MFKNGHFQRDRDLIKSTRRWIDQQISIDGEGEKWVMDLKGFIKKANLTFAAKFIWLVVRHRLSLTAFDNILTWDRVVLVATIVSGFEIDFARSLISVIYMRDLKSSTTYPFA